MMHEVNIRIIFTNSGAQERPYGPHVTDATVEISIPENAVGSVYYLEQAYAEKVIKALVGDYCKGYDEEHSYGMSHYYSAHLSKLDRTNFEPRRSAIWHIRTETPFTD